MRRFGAALLGAVPAFALAASGVIAQQLGEVCPDAQPGTGALWGLVADEEAGIGLGGVVVVTTLTDDFLRVDLSFTLADAGSDDRLWACPGSRVDPAGWMGGRALFRDSARLSASWWRTRSGWAPTR